MVRAGTRPVALATDATPQDTGYAKRSSDGAQILILIFELKRGKAPNHVQVWYRCEIVNQFFGQTIDEVLFNHGRVRCCDHRTDFHELLSATTSETLPGELPHPELGASPDCVLVAAM